MGRYESLAIVVLCCIGTIHSQENAKRSIPPSLIECYDDELNAKYNLLPHTMEMFIAIIRKIEKYPFYNMDLRQLSTAILHRFRQDGIEMNPEVRPQAGIMPYAPLGKQFYRHAQTLRIVPGDAVNFPNDSISAVERCTLHSMLSSSIDKYKHPGEPRGCRSSNYGSNYRFSRFSRAAQGPKDDVETLSPEQVEMLMSKDQVDPNSKYPAFPPNHPSGSARLTDDQLSECPIESGVLKTPWGSVSGGSVLAGIAAGMIPQRITIGELIKQQVEPRVFNDLDTNANLDNKFLATLAGDLAEVALAQGPHSRGKFSVGAEGTWNSTTNPIYYFLGGKDDLQMTAAEIRGDLDGLILANQVPEYQRKINQLRLSQVLELYYSDRGLFDPKNRACNRRAHLPIIAPTAELEAQTHSSAIVLSSVGYATVTISPQMIETFSKQAVKDFGTFVPLMGKDNNCDTDDHMYARAISSSSSSSTNSKPAVDLTIIVDTNWPFDELQPVVSQILTGLNIDEYGSNFTIINGFDGMVIVNSSDSILNFAGKFNISIYDLLSKGFNLAQSVEQLRNLQTWKLDEKKRRGLAGGKSDVVVIMPHHGNLNPSDREFVMKSFEDMRIEVPDARILFLANGQKDVWADLVQDSDDVISINYSENVENNPAIDAILTRIKQVPRRLSNTQCGSNYEQSGNTRELEAAVGPNEVNFYRIHPNYFMSDDSDKPKLKIQSFGSPLKICWSRELLHVNASAARMAATCNNIVSNTQTIEMDCEGASYINQCKPYYLSVESNSNSSGKFNCLERKYCKFPDDIHYRISFERLVCKSGASTLLVAPLLLLATLARLFI